MYPRHPRHPHNWKPSKPPAAAVQRRRISVRSLPLPFHGITPVWSWWSHHGSHQQLGFAVRQPVVVTKDWNQDGATRVDAIMLFFSVREPKGWGKGWSTTHCKTHPKSPTHQLGFRTTSTLKLARPNLSYAAGGSFIQRISQNMSKLWKRQPTGAEICS